MIPNWSDTALLRPQRRPTTWAQQRKLAGTFMVMHAGNIGQLQGLDVALEAAARLPEVRLVIVGEGSGRFCAGGASVTPGDHKRRLLPWEPHSRMAEVLSSADAQLVSLVPGLAGLLEPSKLYGVLAVGRPVLAALDAKSEGAMVVREERCGVVAPPGDPQALADAISALAGMSEGERTANGSWRSCLRRAYRGSPRRRSSVCARFPHRARIAGGRSDRGPRGDSSVSEPTAARRTLSCGAVGVRAYDAWLAIAQHTIQCDSLSLRILDHAAASIPRAAS